MTIQQAGGGSGAEAAPGEPAQAPAPGETFRSDVGGRVIEIGEDGILEVDAEAATATTQPGFEFTPVIPQEAVVISVAFFVMIAVILIGWPISRAFARRMDRSAVAPASGSAKDAERLVRIEQAVEAMAIEVERISENQRFVTRLLSEGAAAPLAVGARAGADEARALEPPPVRR